MHNSNMIMRDLKPENIIMNKSQNQVYLCDLGWASKLDDKEWLKRKAGTFAYMSLE